MAKLISLYKKPHDPAAFNDYYYSKHVPLVKKVEGLRSFEVNNGWVTNLAGKTPYHLVAILTFDSVAAIQQALASPEGKAAAADLPAFAQAGVELLVINTKEV
jgi:uncharacterized protein (TIGR02118 family)